VTDGDLALGRIFPPAKRMREVAAAVATAVARVAWDQGLAVRDRPADIASYIERCMVQPGYGALRQADAA
jgi:malic enzyme